MITFGALVMRDAIEAMRAGVITEMERRGKVATGRTISTLATSVTVSTAAITATLTGEDQWRYVGNGRAPGRRPPLGPIQQWIDAKGLTISAHAVANTIAKRGTKDWRNKAPNVFFSAFEDFENGPKVKKLEEDTAGEFEQQAINLAIKYLRDGGLN